MGCTLPEWLGWLPAAIGEHPYSLEAELATIHIGEGKLVLSWRVGEPRVIALARIPRLLVRFAFDGLDDGERYTFMRRFDLYTQRGGG